MILILFMMVLFYSEKFTVVPHVFAQQILGYLTVLFSLGCILDCSIVDSTIW